MHGEGRLLMHNGNIWAGQFWKVRGEESKTNMPWALMP